MEKKKHNQKFNKDIIVYWKNQKRPVKGELFNDPLFPPNEHSLLAQNANGEWIDPEEGPKRSPAIEVSKIEWKRASEIFPKYLLFEESISPNDIKQGKLGNCYFLSSLASMCEYPNLIYQIFITRDVNADGFYEVVLFLDGKYQIVVVDDYFPVMKGTNIVYFAKPNNNELWVMLLEKVWAKVNGGYANIIAGWPCDPLEAFTGYSTEKLIHDELDLKHMWFRIKQADKHNSILCASTRNEEMDKLGLIKNHAYTLIDTIELQTKGKKVNLCKIRNPWGYKEWNGDWSDKSPLWGEEEKKQITFEEKDDGSFWMNMEDFKKYFARTDICYVMYNCNIKFINVKGKDIKEPNIINFHLKLKSKVSISICRKYWRYNRELSKSPHPAVLIIMKYDPVTFQLSEMLTSFDCYDECGIFKLFHEGYYVAFCYQDYDNCKGIKPEDYIIRIASTHQIKYLHVGFDKNFELLREMFIQSIMEEKKDQITTTEVYKEISNNYQSSGIGYRFIYNPFSTSYEKWNNDPVELKGMFLLPPNKNGEVFKMMVPPQRAAIALGMRSDNYGAYCFKLKSSKSTLSCKEGEDPTKTKRIQMEDYCNVEVADQNTKEPLYYDFVSAGVEQAKEGLEFEKIDLEKVMTTDLEAKEPEMMKHVLKMKPVADESLLQWCYISRDTGLYVGQSTNGVKEGRGAFRFASDNSYWIGYWSKNQKHGMGYVFDKKMKLTFEGLYVNNERQGQGKLYFNSGDHYEGEFAKNKRTGHGVYYWKDKSKWEGNFTDNEMNGVGTYTDTEGNSFPATYKNGEIVE